MLIFPIRITFKTAFSEAKAHELVKKMRIVSIVFLFLVANYAQACDKTSCTPTPSHYEELGCEPILDEDKCCPIRYACPERSESAGGCQYRGKLYKVGESITEQFLPKRCDAECTCEHGEEEGTFKLACRGFEEEEIDAYVAENTLARVVDRKLDESTHYPIERCYGVPITETADLARNKKIRCNFDGNIYKNGDRILPDGTCIECICDRYLKTQDLDIFTAQCQRRQCGMGTSAEEQELLNQGCVPVYEQTKTTCCPIDWRCPTPDDVITKSGLTSNRNMRCQFGSHALNVLDHVTYAEGDKLNCKCYTPPMVHCLKDI